MPRRTINRTRTELYVTSKMLMKPGQGVYVWKRFNPVTASYDHIEVGQVTATRSDHCLQLLGLVHALERVEEGTAVTCVVAHRVVLRQAQDLATLERNGFRRNGKTIANIDLWREVARLVSTRSVGFRHASRRGEDRRVMSEMVERANHALDTSNAQ
ncbi:ribonuclease HI [Devosia subaequoris]|uniref:Ribonuclease HI n=1 Tax=Devosia subaequoris TaxID=395930 RepID=A0A7W6IQQ5_9HYPH|nr:ribonuclease HI [Devosia subaequoris]